MYSQKKKIQVNDRNFCRRVKKDEQLSWRRHIEYVPHVQSNHRQESKASLLGKLRFQKANKNVKSSIPKPVLTTPGQYNSLSSKSLHRSQNTRMVSPNIGCYDKFKSRLPVLKNSARHKAHTQKCINKSENSVRDVDWKHNSIVKSELVRTSSAPSNSVDPPAPKFPNDVSSIEPTSFAPLEFTFEAPENVQDFSFLLLRTSTLRKSVLGISVQENTAINGHLVLCDNSNNVRVVKGIDNEPKLLSDYADIVVKNSSVELQDQEVTVPIIKITGHREILVNENSKCENICDSCMLKLPLNEHSSSCDSKSDSVGKDIASMPKVSSEYKVQPGTISERSERFSDGEIASSVINDLEHDLLSLNFSCDKNVCDEISCLNSLDKSDLYESQESSLEDSSDFSNSHSHAQTQYGKLSLHELFHNQGVQHCKFSNSQEFLNFLKIGNEFDMNNLLEKEKELCCESRIVYENSNSDSLVEQSLLYDISEVTGGTSVSHVDNDENGRISPVKDIEADECFLEDESLYDISNLKILDLTPPSQKYCGKHNSLGTNACKVGKNSLKDESLYDISNLKILDLTPPSQKYCGKLNSLGANACKVGKNSSKGTVQATKNVDLLSNSISSITPGSPFSSNIMFRQRRAWSPVIGKASSDKENCNVQTPEGFYASNSRNDSLSPKLKSCKPRISLFGSPLRSFSPQRVIDGDLITFSPPIRF